MFTCTCGWAPGSIPGGRRSAILAGSVRYTILSRGQFAISPGTMVGGMVGTIAPVVLPRNRGGRVSGIEIKDVSHVSIGVSDMERSIAFYRDVFGWEQLFDERMG